VTVLNGLWMLKGTLRECLWYTDRNWQD